MRTLILVSLLVGKFALASATNPFRDCLDLLEQQGAPAVEIEMVVHNELPMDNFADLIGRAAREEIYLGLFRIAYDVPTGLAIGHADASVTVPFRPDGSLFGLENSRAAVVMGLIKLRETLRPEFGKPFQVQAHLQSWLQFIAHAKTYARLFDRIEGQSNARQTVESLRFLRYDALLRTAYEENAPFEAQELYDLAGEFALRFIDDFRENQEDLASHFIPVENFLRGQADVRETALKSLNELRYTLAAENVARIISDRAGAPRRLVLLVGEDYAPGFHETLTRAFGETDRLKITETRLENLKP